jgi:3-hydroxyacyl-CoA dehydrogenase
MTWKDPVIGCRPVTILGVGILDRRIACSFVAGGYSVHIRDPSAEVRQAAVQYLGDNKRQYARNIPGDANAVQPGAYGTIEDMEQLRTWLQLLETPGSLLKQCLRILRSRSTHL